jgi:hypothetical protein
VLTNVSAILRNEGTGIQVLQGSQSTALGSVVLQKNSAGKASTLVGMFPRIEPRKRRVLFVPRSQPQVVGHSSLCARYGTNNGHGTAPNKQWAWMDALFVRFSLPTTMFNESEPRSISQSIDYVRETEAAGRATPPRSVTTNAVMTLVINFWISGTAWELLALP